MTDNCRLSVSLTQPQNSKKHFLEAAEQKLQASQEIKVAMETEIQAAEKIRIDNEAKQAELVAREARAKEKKRLKRQREKERKKEKKTKEKEEVGAQIRKLKEVSCIFLSFVSSYSRFVPFNIFRDETN